MITPLLQIMPVHRAEQGTESEFQEFKDSEWVKDCLSFKRASFSDKGEDKGNTATRRRKKNTIPKAPIAEAKGKMGK